MKELLRFEHITVQSLLTDFSLSVREGDILYLQSTSGRRIRMLASILSGEKTPEEGTILLQGKEFHAPTAEDYDAARIYSAHFGREFNEQMTIAENMNMSSRGTRWYRIYSRKKIEERVQRYLQEETEDLDPSMPVYLLNERERWKLGLLRARLYHARLVIMDLTADPVTGEAAHELMQVMKKMQDMGISFLVLSAGYSSISRIAGRCRLMSHGREGYEFQNAEEAQKALHETYANSPETIRSLQAAGRSMVGFLDSSWDYSRSFSEYLQKFRSSSPQIWQDLYGDMVPSMDVHDHAGGLIIPQESENMLFPNLTIGQNLTIACRHRITGRTGAIRPHMEEKLVADYYRLFQLDPSVTDIAALIPVQRKILSIARAAITRPDVLFLEDPYLYIDGENVPFLQAYLNELAAAGIRIACFSRTDEQMKTDCGMIIRTENGENAKISTFL